MLTFIPLAIVMIIGSLGVITLRQPVHASLSLVATLLTLAVTYVTLEAHFLATTQVIVYAGAIMVLFLFVIMLLNIQGDTQELAFKWMRPAAYAVGVLAAAGLIISVLRNPSQLPDKSVIDAALVGGGPEQVADALFGEFVLAFQLVGVLLLTGIIGAVSLVQRRAEEAEAREQRQAGDSLEPAPALAISSGGTAVMEPPRGRSASDLPDEPEDVQTLQEAEEAKPVVREISAKDADKKPEKVEAQKPEKAESKAEKKADKKPIKTEPEKKAPKAKKAAPKPKAKKPKAKKAKGKGYGPERDDLKKISGIGPKLEQLLNDNGVKRFEQIAKFDEQDIENLNEQLGSFRGRIERDDWVSQAKELAKK